MLSSPQARTHARVSVMTWAGISAQSSGYATARSHAYNQHNINDHAPHDVTTERQPPPGRPPPGTQTSAGRTRHSGLHAARGKQTYARSPKVYPGTRVRPRVLRASDLDVLRSAMTATASEPGQSSQRTGNAINVRISSERPGVGRTKRHSPASANGLVVNHSHMNALVDPSFTESIKPRMSLLTAGNRANDRDPSHCNDTSTYP